MSSADTLRRIQPRPTALVFAQVTAVTARGHQLTGGFLMILLPLFQQRQFSIEFYQQLRPTHAPTLGLLWIETQHITLAPLAITEPHFFDLQIVGDLLYWPDTAV